jgi:carboxyl-terminal processing protease
MPSTWEFPLRKKSRAVTLRIIGPAALVLLLSAACAAQSGSAVPSTKSDPVAYLNRALDQMQQHALRSHTVDWPRLRAEALAKIRGADSTVATYDAIRFALASLGDHHSSLHLTPPLQALDAQRHSATAPAPKASGDNPNFSPYVGRYEPEGHIETRNGKQFALVVVTKCFPENDRQFVAFETNLQQIVRDLDNAHPSGWIVDLRGNVGGNMWPMLAGIGPLLGEGDHLGEFFNTNGHSVWLYRNGVAAEVENGKLNAYPAVAGQPYHLAGTPNVAVLIDRSTGSSGEAIAIAFRGREHTRSFGEHTEGVSTVNDVVQLSDGATLWLTIGVQADRAGKQYPDGISPDVTLPAATERLAPSLDQVVQAAEDWLNEPSTPPQTEP